MNARDVVRAGVAAAVLVEHVHGRDDLTPADRELVELVWSTVLDPVPAGTWCRTCDSLTAYGPHGHRVEQCRGPVVTVWAFGRLPTAPGRRVFADALLAWSRDVLPATMRGKFFAGELRRARTRTVHDATPRVLDTLAAHLDAYARAKGLA